MTGSGSADSPRPPSPAKKHPRLADRIGDYDVLLVVSLVWFLAKFVRYLFPPLFERFQLDYGVSTATLGLLFTLMMVAYGAMQFPSGALGDRLGSTRVVVAGVCLVGLATIGLAVSQSLAVLAVAMVVIGVGTGLHKTVAIDLVATVYPERTGRMLGTMDAIGELAGVAAPAVVVALLGAALGWDLAFLASAIAAVGLAAAAIAVARRRRRRAPADGSATTTAPDRLDGPTPAGAYLSAFARPRFLLFVGVVMAFSFVWNGVTAFLPLYLTAAKGLSTAWAGLLYAVVFAVGLVQPATGAVADRLGRHPVLVTALAVQAVALVGLVWVSGPWPLLVAVAALGLGIHGFRPARDAYLVAVVPRSTSGGTLGMVRTVMIGAGAVSPAAVGTVADAAGFDAAFAGLGAAVVLALVVSAGLAVTD